MTSWAVQQDRCDSHLHVCAGPICHLLRIPSPRLLLSAGSLCAQEESAVIKKEGLQRDTAGGLGRLLQALAEVTSAANCALINTAMPMALQKKTATIPVCMTTHRGRSTLLTLSGCVTNRMHKCQPYAQCLLACPYENRPGTSGCKPLSCHRVLMGCTHSRCTAAAGWSPRDSALFHPC